MGLAVQEEVVVEQMPQIRQLAMVQMEDYMVVLAAVVVRQTRGVEELVVLELVAPVLKASLSLPTRRQEERQQ
jgi:hypothetical protein